MDDRNRKVLILRYSSLGASCLAAEKRNSLDEVRSLERRMSDIEHQLGMSREEIVEEVRLILSRS